MSDASGGDRQAAGSRVGGSAPDTGCLPHRAVLLPDLLVAALDRGDERDAIHTEDGVVTVRVLRDHISRYAQALAAVGVERTGSIAMLSTNRAEVLYLLGAELIVGCVSTPLYPTGSLEDHAYVLCDAGVGTLVFDPLVFETRARELHERVPGLTLLALGPSRVGLDLVELAATQEPGPLRSPDVSPEDVQRIGYTGGTTGRPKGVVHTFRSRTALVDLMLGWEWPTRPRHLACAPLSHAGGTFFLPVLLKGGSVVVLPKFDPVAVLAAIERHRVTSVMLVPTMIYALLDCPTLGDYDLSSLEVVYYGASAISPTRLRAAIERIGPVFFQFYGQAESPMSVTVLRRDEHDLSRPERLASCGRPVPWLRVELLDECGEPVRDGEPGEICVRGPLVMAGYRGRETETAAAFAHGWLHTGDLATRDSEGYLTIVDRTKDMVVTGGINVYPREVEDVIVAHPAVAAAAVFGVPHERWGEAVMAAVVLRPGMTVEKQELVALVRERRGAFAAPKDIEFVDHLPLTGLGKPDKVALRAEYGDGVRRRVS